MNLKIEVKSKEKKLRCTDVELNLISTLDCLVDKLYTLNSEIENSFFEKDMEMPNELSLSIESFIDNVDKLYTEEAVRPICKKAIIDGISKDEFEKLFDELCVSCDVKNSQTLTEIAINIFEAESLIFKNL